MDFFKRKNWNSTFRVEVVVPHRTRFDWPSVLARIPFQYRLFWDGFDGSRNNFPLAFLS